MQVKFLCSIMLVIMASLVHGVKQEVPLYIQSENAKLYQAKQLIIHKDNVKINHGNSHMTAKQVNSYFDDNKKLVKAIAYSSPKQQSHYWDQFDSDGSEFHAYADLIEYLPKKDIVIFNGNVTIKNEQGTHNAAKVRYNLKTKQMFSNSEKGKKVVITFALS